MAVTLKYRVGIILKNGNAVAKNVATKGAADTYILEVDEKQGVKHYRVMDRTTKEIVVKGNL